MWEVLSLWTVDSVAVVVPVTNVKKKHTHTKQKRSPARVQAHTQWNQYSLTDTISRKPTNRPFKGILLKRSPNSQLTDENHGRNFRKRWSNSIGSHAG